MKEDKKTLPEAPATAWTNIKTPNGFAWSFTMRSETVSELVKQIETIEEIFKAKKWEAQEIRSNGFKGKKETEYAKDQSGNERHCPKCGGRLLVKEKNGKKYFPCENGKYDFLTKTRSGCNYVDWGDLNVRPMVGDHDREEQININEIEI